MKQKKKLFWKRKKEKGNNRKYSRNKRTLMKIKGRKGVIENIIQSIIELFAYQQRLGFVLLRNRNSALLSVRDPSYSRIQTIGRLMCRITAGSRVLGIENKG